MAVLEVLPREGIDVVKGEKNVQTEQWQKIDLLVDNLYPFFSDMYVAS